MGTPRSHSWVFVAASACGLLAACNQLLGIEEASVDARLSAAGLETSGSGGGSGSSQAGSENGAASGTTNNAGSGGSVHTHTGDEDGGEPASDGGSDGNSGASSGGTHQGHGGTNDDSSQAGASGEGGGDGAPPDLCEQYCDEMGSQCAGAAAQYRDRDQCLRICRLLPEGNSAGPDENSVECRLKYAQKARYGLGTEVNVYCSQAGPSGDGRCGSVCEGFCSVMATVCTAETAGPYHFANDEDCRTTCNGLPPAGIAYSSSDPAISDGNHALCRLFHVTSAAMADPEEHCEHALGITLCEAPAL